MRKALAMTVLALVLAGCINGQGAFVDSTSSHFKPGVTTRAHVHEHLDPAHHYQRPLHRRIWIHQYSHRW